MPSIVIPFTDAGPQLEVVLRARESRSYQAMVDSGASMSGFPLTVARDLGIDESELEQTSVGGRGMGEEFATWKARHVPILGQVLVAVEDGGVEPFGSEFAVDPVFFQVRDRFLLGQADFFDAFDVYFFRARPRRFQLTC